MGFYVIIEQVRIVLEYLVGFEHAQAVSDKLQNEIEMEHESDKAREFRAKAYLIGFSEVLDENRKGTRVKTGI